MSTQVLDQQEVNSIPSSAYTGSQRAVTISFPPAFTVSTRGYAEPKQPEESNADGLGVIRGLRVALFIECAAGFAVYGIWHFWHVLR